MPEYTDLESRVIASLDGLGVAYDLIPCDPDLADTAAFCEHYGYPLDKSANTIIVASKKEPKQYAACVVTGAARLDVNKRVRALMGGLRLSFAKPDETARLTGMVLGGVTVLALPPDLSIFVDEAIADLDYMIVGGGSRSLKVKVSPHLFDLMPQAEFVGGLTLPPPD